MERTASKPFVVLLCLLLLLAACDSPAGERSATGSPRPTPIGQGRIQPIPAPSHPPVSPKEAAGAPTAATSSPASPLSATVREGASLRSGPGTQFALVGSVQAGQVLQIVSQNPAGDWLQLAGGSWIFAGLVANAPGVPVAQTAAAGPQTPVSSGVLRVHVIDVGQGDSILIEAPEGHNVLIDAGEAGSGALAYLQGHAIQKLDLVVLTHAHSDHIGGLPEVLDAIPVSLVVASGQPHTTGEYEKLIDTIMARKIPYQEVKQGDILPLGNLSLEVLWPFQTQPTGDLNNNSLVLRLVLGQTVFQFEGDAGQDAENRMRSAGLITPVTFLKVGHHGSRDASGSAFLRAVKPQFAVYSAGLGNSYGLPAPETIAALEAVAGEVHGTDKEGTVIVTSDGAAARVSTIKARAESPARPAATASTAGLALASPRRCAATAIRLTRTCAYHRPRSPRTSRTWRTGFCRPTRTGLTGILAWCM